METFFALLVPCERNPPVTAGLPSQRPVTRSLDIFFDPVPEQTEEHSIETSLISNAIALIVASL